MYAYYSGLSHYMTWVHYIKITSNSHIQQINHQITVLQPRSLCHPDQGDRVVLGRFTDSSDFKKGTHFVQNMSSSKRKFEIIFSRVLQVKVIELCHLLCQLQYNMYVDNVCVVCVCLCMMPTSILKHLKSAAHTLCIDFMPHYMICLTSPLKSTMLQTNAC